MSVHELHPVRVFISLRILQSPPAHVWRREGLTLLTNDPRCSRMELTEANVGLLTDDEGRYVRAGYGWDSTQPIPDWTTDDGPAYLYVPAPLRLTGAPAIQGGSELVRRRRANLLVDEWAAWMQELRTAAQETA